MPTTFSCLLTAKANVSPIEGTVSNATIDAQGPGGNASVHITGADNSFVSFGTQIGQFGTNDFTVAFWVQTTESYRYFDLAGNRTAGSHGNFFCIRMTGKHESRPAGIISAEVDQDQNGTNYIGVESKTAGFNDGKWHHIAVVRKGASLTLYVDGVVSGNTTGTGVANIANGHPFKLGRSLVGVHDKFAANARYSGLRVYDTALNDSDISSLFSGDKATVPGLIGIGTNNQLYTRKTLTSNWENIPNSCCVIGITVMPDGTIVGIGTNNQLYTRKTLTSNWEHIPNSGSVLGITVMPDGTIV
ncbi:MAG: LamG-like jellyroll fold domain-containing protein, partial [Sphaerospermopsis kisseleviana]